MTRDLERAMRFLDKLKARGAMQEGGVIPCYVPFDKLAAEFAAIRAEAKAEQHAADVKALQMFQPEGVDRHSYATGEYWADVLEQRGPK